MKNVFLFYLYFYDRNHYKVIKSKSVINLVLLLLLDIEISFIFISGFSYTRVYAAVVVIGYDSIPQVF